MHFRTLHEFGHDEKLVKLIESGEGAEESHSRHLAGTDVILVPQPSQDVNDPLRWPTWKKYVAFLNVCLFAFMTTGFISGFSPALYLLGLELQTPQNILTGLITYPMVTCGVGNFLWVPAAEYLGKRPVFVVSSLILFGGTVGSAVAPTFSVLQACRIVAAFGGASTEALGAAIINDIFYLHERGSKMGIYIIFLYGGNSVLSLISGFMVQQLGWRWFCWLCTIISGLNSLAIFLFVHETRFDRNSDLPVSLGGQVDQEKLEAVGKTAIPTVERVEPLENETTTDRTGTKKTFLQNLSLWSGVSNESFFSLLMRPYLLIAYPAVLWGTIAYSLCLAWQIAANTLSSFIFQPPPYNFSPGINGLINIPAILGNLLGSYTGGQLTDIWVQHWARTHRGIFHPESRLVLLVVPALLVPAGLLMFGFGAERHLHWAVLYLGYFLLNVSNSAASIAMTYVMDSYFEVAAEALLLVNGLKNVVGFGFTYGFLPWTKQAGYEKVFGTMAAIYFAWMAAAIPLYFFGKRWRAYSTSKMKVIFW